MNGVSITLRSDAWTRSLRKALSPLAVRARRQVPPAPEGLWVLEEERTGLEEVREHLKNAALAGRSLAILLRSDGMDGHEVLRWMDAGVIGLLFSDAPSADAARRILQIHHSLQGLEEYRQKQLLLEQMSLFLEQVAHLTSDRPLHDVLEGHLLGLLNLTQAPGAALYLKKGAHLARRVVLPEQAPYPQHLEARSLRRHTASRYHSCTPARAKALNLPGRQILIPLQVHQKTMAWVLLSQPEAPVHPLLLQTFARLCGIALENGRLYWDVLQTRQQLVEQEKKSLLAQMVISLNHEINNPLSVISMETQLLQRHKEVPRQPDSAVVERLGRIEQNIERIRSIMERISRIDPVRPETAEYLDGSSMLRLHHGHQA